MSVELIDYNNIGGIGFPSLHPMNKLKLVSTTSKLDPQPKKPKSINRQKLLGIALGSFAGYNLFVSKSSLFAKFISGLVLGASLWMVAYNQEDKEIPKWVQNAWIFDSEYSKTNKSRPSIDIRNLIGIINEPKLDPEIEENIIVGNHENKLN